MRLCFLFSLALFFFTASAFAMEKNSDFTLFESIFTSWTDAFNRKDLARSCQLFSKNITANYQGAPTKSYASICDGFKKVFGESRNYHYSFKLHQVYRSNNLAAVRITWFLSISEHGKVVTHVQDEGLDILRQDEQDDWKIINYLGYPV